MVDGTDHGTLMGRLARTAVRTGVRLRHGQELVVHAPVAAAPLARLVAREAYAAGAPVVTVLWTDDDVSLARFEAGGDGAFDASTPWLFDGLARAYADGAAVLSLRGEDPFLLSGQDAGKVGRANRSRAAAYKPVMDVLIGFGTNWGIVPSATPAWARAVYPGLPEGEALERLWSDLFDACRVRGEDPVADWAAHNAELDVRRAALDGARYTALRFRGPGTDLTVGLADGHQWHGGETRTADGHRCNANIPTEEIYTAPDRLRVDGHATSSRPLSYAGTLVRDIRVRFEGGRIIESSASAGGEVLERLLGTDEGASRLGEVALVPASSPIARSGRLFYNTLLDENAASHVAVGMAYPNTLGGGDAEDRGARGGNASSIHVDWMIGSADMDVDGIREDGSSVPVMRGGEWA